jgi:F-type H+-transporting ATPase subunit b
MNLNATLLGQAIAFVLFVLFCMRYVWPPLLAAIEARQQTIAEGLTAAEEAKKALKLAQSEVALQLQKAKNQAQVIIEQANRERTQILEEAKIKVQQERTKVLAQAQVEAEQICQREHETLRKQFGQLVVLATEKLINSTIDSESSQQIVEQLVAEL